MTARLSILGLAKQAADSWVGFDLDGTLALREEPFNPESVGEPIPKMVKKLREHLDAGDTCKIMTARAADGGQAATKVIQDWLEEQDLPRLEVTNEKDPGMTKLYDDRAVSVKTDDGATKEAAEEPPAEELMKRPCCGSGCQNCPYVPRHVAGTTKVRENLKSASEDWCAKCEAKGEDCTCDDKEKMDGWDAPAEEYDAADPDPPPSVEVMKIAAHTHAKPVYQVVKRMAGGKWKVAGPGKISADTPEEAAGRVLESANKDENIAREDEPVPKPNKEVYHLDTGVDAVGRIWDLDAIEKAAVIKQEGSEWILYTKDGKRVLGRHKSKQDAIKQEYAIQKSEERRKSAALTSLTFWRARRPRIDLVISR